MTVLWINPNLSIGDSSSRCFAFVKFFSQSHYWRYFLLWELWVGFSYTFGFCLGLGFFDFFFFSVYLYFDVFFFKNVALLTGFDIVIRCGMDVRYSLARKQLVWGTEAGECFVVLGNVTCLSKEAVLHYIISSIIVVWTHIALTNINMILTIGNNLITSIINVLSQEFTVYDNTKASNKRWNLLFQSANTITNL